MNIVLKMKDKDFKTVYKYGLLAADLYLVVYLLNTDFENIRVGFSVSKKVGNSVIRHKITRRLRAICKNELSNDDKSYDMVIVARPKITTISYNQILHSILSLIKRIKKCKNEETAHSNN